MNFLKKSITAVLCGSVILSMGAVLPGTFITVHAATFNNINASSVFIKQKQYDTCTLCANAMLLRRAAILRGDSDWSTITENGCRSDLWYEGIGMVFDYTYRNIEVSYSRVQYDAVSELKEVLSQHPEGVVAYDYDYPHAILLTDYTNGTFYCADPANNTPSGRMNVSNALISVSGVEGYWYVESPSLSLSGSSSTIIPEITSVNESWKITSDSGVNLRSGAGTEYSSKGIIPYNTAVKVTKKTTVNGYTWGYITYDSNTGWIALDYAEKEDTSELKNLSTLSSSSITCGNSVTIKGEALGGSGLYDYCYSYRLNSSSEWVDIKGYSSAKKVVFKPKSTGSYYIRIKVHDSVTGKVVQKGITLTVDNAIKNSSSISTTKADYKSPITIKGSASGGIGTYQYAYYCKKSSSSGWYTIKGYSSSTSVSYTPVAVTDYDFMVRVKDSSNKVAEKKFKVNVSKPLVNKSYAKSDSLTFGDEMKLIGSATGGTGTYQYAYYCRKSSSSGWYTIKGYSTSTSVSYTPVAAVNYDVMIRVKDSLGRVSEKFFQINVNNKLSNNSKALSTVIKKGTAMKLIGSASGGTGTYQYAYYCRKSGSEGWYTIKGYSSSTSVSYTPVAAVNYDVMIRVKDSAGKVTEKKFTVKVTK